MLLGQTRQYLHFEEEVLGQIISFEARRQHLKVLKGLPTPNYPFLLIMTKAEYFLKVFRLGHPKEVGLFNLHRWSKFVFGQACSI